MFTCSFMMLLALALGSEEPLSLADALERSLAVHPLGLAAEARLDQVRAERLSAAAALGPELSGTGSYTRRPTEVTVGDENTVLQARDALKAQATAKLPLIDPAAYKDLAAANSGLAAQEISSDEERRALAYEVADAFLAVLAAERLAGAAESHARRADELLASAQARLEAGVGTRNDVTRTALEQATAQLEGVQAQGALATARSVLASLLLMDPPAALTEPDLATPGEARSSPDLAILQLEARQARQEAGAARLEPLPVISAFSTASATNEPGFSGRHTDWSAGLSASWNLLDGGTQLAAANRAQARARELEAEADGRLLEVEQERDAARIALRTAEAALEVAGIRATVAEQNAEEQRVRFESGLCTAYEVTDAATTAFEAAAGLAWQRFETWRALLTLAEVLGYWPEEILR